MPAVKTALLVGLGIAAISCARLITPDALHGLFVYLQVKYMLV
jgi:hypothetical protein